MTRFLILALRPFLAGPAGEHCADSAGVGLKSFTGDGERYRPSPKSLLTRFETVVVRMKVTYHWVCPPMSYSFRIRVNRSLHKFIDSDLTEVDLSPQDSGVALFLRAGVHEKSIKEAEQLVLAGEGFISEEAAKEAGQRFEDVFMVALAKGRIGADFGDRAPKSFFTLHGLKSFFGLGERPTLNNVHGMMVYPSEPKPQFVALGPGTLLVGMTIETFQIEFRAAAERNRKLTDRERIAFTLFNSSCFQPGADARFLLLMMAIEALIEPAQKSSEAMQLVDGFINQTKESAVQRAEKDSLIGSLKWLRDESINKAGQRLVREKLGDEAFEGKTASEFFADAYSIRSRLVHGKVPFPTFREIHRLGGTLELFVSHLLTAD
jgi:Apea-like HEPN